MPWGPVSLTTPQWRLRPSYPRVHGSMRFLFIAVGVTIHLASRRGRAPLPPMVPSGFGLSIPLLPQPLRRTWNYP